MRNKKIISRVLVFIIALIMMLTFLPPNLIAFAGLGGVGNGDSLSGGGGSSTGNNDSLLNEEVGLRFSLVTLKNGKRTVVETKYPGKYFIDAWCQSGPCGPLPLDSWYRAVTPNTRYATEAGTAGLAIPHEVNGNGSTAICSPQTARQYTTYKRLEPLVYTAYQKADRALFFCLFFRKIN